MSSTWSPTLVDVSRERPFSHLQPFSVHVATLEGKTFPITVLFTTTVRDLKREIQEEEGTTPGDQLLIWGGKPLSEDRTLEEYNVKKNGTLQLFSISYLSVLMGTKQVGGCMEIDARMLDPARDYDFTNKRDNGTVFRRGGEIYNRPWGWKRYALAVLGKYENDDWLDDKADGDGWPVSYHGTSKDCAKAISEDGYLLSKGERFGHGRGIYTTPDIATAKRFSTAFNHNGDQYQVVLQNRVNPKTLLKVATSYWLSPNEDDVRPYGILIRKRSPFN